MAVTNASATNLTASGYLQAASVVITGTASSSGITFTNATGTGNLEIATFRVTGSSTLATAGGTAGVGIGTTTVGNLFTIATATPIFVVSGTTGRIGIGTSSPVDDFEVAEALNNDLRMKYVKMEWDDNNPNIAMGWIHNIPKSQLDGIGGFMNFES